MSNRDSDEDRILGHDYDGIQEYDNPMPAWWVWIFWVTILFSIGMSSGKLNLSIIPPIDLAANLLIRSSSSDR